MVNVNGMFVKDEEEPVGTLTDRMDWSANGCSNAKSIHEDHIICMIEVNNDLVKY